MYQSMQIGVIPEAPENVAHMLIVGEKFMVDASGRTLRDLWPRMNRRTALKTIGLGAGALSLSGCGLITDARPTGLTALGKDPAPGRKVVIDLYNIFGSAQAPAFIALFGVPLFIFLLRQFFMSIPRDLSEAARVDGANELTIFFRLILPLSRPALAAIALFQFLFSWSDFLGPLIYLNDSNKYTVSIGLTFFQGQYTTEYGALMAVSTVMLIPVIILFFFAQRTFIQGITLTGVKG